MQTPQPNVAFAAATGFTVSSVLNRAITVFRQNLMVFLVLGVISVVPVALIEAFMPENVAISSALGIVNWIIGLAIQGAVTYAVFQVMRSAKASLGEALSKGMARLGALILTGLLVLLGTAAPLIVAGIIGGAVGSTVALGLLVLIACVPCVILTIMWAVAIPVCVVEKLGSVASMKRSAELTKGYRGTILGLFIVIFLIAVIVLGGFNLQVQHPQS